MKTLPLEGICKTIKAKTNHRTCDTCLEYNKPKKNMCIPVGKIKNPSAIDCSWWKEKFEKTIKTKKCSVCGKRKSIEKFYKAKSTDDGYQYKCIICAREYGKEYQRNRIK